MLTSSTLDSHVDWYMSLTHIRSSSVSPPNHQVSVPLPTCQYCSLPGDYLAVSHSTVILATLKPRIGTLLGSGAWGARIPSRKLGWHGFLWPHGWEIQNSEQTYLSLPF